MSSVLRVHDLVVLTTSIDGAKNVFLPIAVWTLLSIGNPPIAFHDGLVEHFGIEFVESKFY